MGSDVGSSRFVRVFNRGLSQAKTGNYEAAAADFSEVIELQPWDVEAYNNRGFAFQNLGRLDEAMDDYDRSIELKPDDWHVYYYRSIALAQLGRTEEAYADLAKAEALMTGAPAPI